MDNYIKIDGELKLELLIKLAFGIPLEELEKEYDLPKMKIVNLRKNNYVKYNEFFEYWKIDKKVAELGLTPKYERALSIIKKFYKDKVQINGINNITFKGKLCSLEDVIEIADKTLQKDNIYGFRYSPVNVKNYY